MKRLGVLGATLVFMASPLMVSAQTYTYEQKASIIATLQQLIVILTNELDLLIAQRTPESPTFGASTPIPTITSTTPEITYSVAPTQITQTNPPLMQDSITISVEDTRITKPAWFEANKGQFPFGYYLLQVRVLKDGKTTPVHTGEAPSESVEMTVDGATEKAFIDTRSGEDYYHTFSFTPAQKGTATIHFKSGNLTQDLSLDVE